MENPQWQAMIVPNHVMHVMPPNPGFKAQACTRMISLSTTAFLAALAVGLVDLHNFIKLSRSLKQGHGRFLHCRHLAGIWYWAHIIGISGRILLCRHLVGILLGIYHGSD